MPERCKNPQKNAIRAGAQGIHLDRKFLTGRKNKETLTGFVSKGPLMARVSLAPARRASALRTLLITCMVALVSTTAVAQSTNGSILGTVHDASGAAIQGAQVMLANVNTAALRTEVTDDRGNYAFRNEPPNMHVDSSGFGSITALQTAEGAGPRSLELTGRIVF
jgi:hypothetical protein